MNLLPVSLASSESSPVGATKAARPSHNKHDADAPGASATNAFAATLAGAIHAPHASATAPKKANAKSDLDANTNTTDATDAKKTTPGDNSDSGTTSRTGTNVGVSDGRPAFAAAAEARAAAAATPVDSANSDTDALNPDFRTRLGRVITRMHDEYGKDVDLVEGYRTQGRQNYLYEQGRSRPGEVVTWTKSSKHTLGLAADVMIDGSYTDLTGYQQLAKIAAQEGLRTLGPKDPGHVELPTHAGAAAWGDALDSMNIDDNVSRAIGIALDQGNGTATGDDGNSSINSFNGFLSRIGRRSPTGAPPILMPSSMSSGGGMAGNMSQSGFSESRRDSSDSSGSARVATVATVADVASVAQVAHVAQVGGMMHIHPMAGSASVAAPTALNAGSDAADKVGRLLDARDAAPVQPLSQMTLNIDNAIGGADTVTVQLRSGAVDAAISVGDPNRADRMSLKVGELQHALEQHGLDATAISVASTANSSGPGWNPRPGSDQGAQNGRASLNYRDNRQDADGTRQRSRREHQGGKGR